MKFKVFIFFMYPIITIVGRPNVGKSTLFNRLVGSKHSLVSDISGTTRDRVYKFAKLDGYNTMIVDTGGLELNNANGTIEADVQKQAHIAVGGADVVLFVIDSRAELTVEDFHVVEILRKSRQRVILVANKCDTPEIRYSAPELYKMGFDDPCFVSAIHNFGFDELENRIIKYLLKAGFNLDRSEDLINEKFINLCFVGKPNAGKSSLVNALCGEDKVIVSEQEGTTRDSTDTQLLYSGQEYNLIDTAGIRRRGKIERGLEKYSVLRAIQAIRRSDISLLIIDFDKGISNQDQHLAGYILDEKKGMIIVINKCDLMDDKEEEQTMMMRRLRNKFPFISWAPVIFTSAITKKHLHKILELADEIKLQRKQRIPTNKMNFFLKKAVMKHSPSPVGKKFRTPPKLYYATQTGIEPPEFVFVANDPEKFHFSYRRFLENEIRAAYGFQGTAINIVLKKRSRKDDCGNTIT